MTTGEKIYELRKKALITQEQFADRLEVSRQAVSKWEQDITFPETDKLIKIAEMFGVSCDYLLMDDPEFKNDTADRLQKSYLKMMTSFGIACILAGFVIAIVCYYAVEAWYSNFVGLGVLAVMYLAAFILWAVGKYKFVANCRYSESDKKCLEKFEKRIFYVAMIVLFCYLPTIAFYDIKSVLTVTGQLGMQIAQIVTRKLYAVEIILSFLIYGILGYATASVVYAVRNKFSGQIGRLELADSILTAFCLLGLTVYFTLAMYENAYGQVEGFYIVSEVTLLVHVYGCLLPVVLIVKTIVHKVFDKTEKKVFIMQIICVILLLLVVGCCFGAFVAWRYDEEHNYIDMGSNVFGLLSYIFGGFLFVAIILLAVFAFKRKSRSLQLKNSLFALVSCTVAGIQLLLLFVTNAAKWFALLYVLLSAGLLILQLIPRLQKNTQ